MDKALAAKRKQHTAWVRLQLAQKGLAEAIQDRDGSRSRDPAVRRALSDAVGRNWDNVRAMRGEYNRVVEAAVQSFRALTEDQRLLVRVRFVDEHRAVTGLEPKDCTPATCTMGDE